MWEILDRTKDTPGGYPGSTWDSVNSGYQIPIPEDWDAGEYYIDWKTRIDGKDVSDRLWFGIPSVDTPPPIPIIYANAYLNSSSPTSRTLHVSTSNVETNHSSECCREFQLQINKDGTRVMPPPSMWYDLSLIHI